MRALCFGDVAAIPTLGSTASALVRAVQERLLYLSNQLNDLDPRKQPLNPGLVDGVFGSSTASAIRALQKENNRAQTGKVDAWVVGVLGVDPQLFADATKATPPPSQPSTGAVVAGGLGLAAVVWGLSRRKSR